MSSPADTYAADRELLRHPEATVRASLAARRDVQPEILYYLAEDPERTIRETIAANPTTPAKADLLLARDGDVEVRAAVALKIARLAPHLTPAQQEQVGTVVLDALRLLAADALPRIRVIVAEEIKRADNLPADLIRQLAHDTEALVANPVLECSPLLRDEDLLDVINRGAAAGRLSAIARRQGVSHRVADAIATTLDEAAVAALLANQSAQIREETLDLIIDHAAAMPRWHEPLVLRPILPARAAERLVRFLASNFVSQLVARHDLDAGLRQRLQQSVQERLQNPAPGAAADNGAARAAALVAAGQLTDEAVADAIDAGDRGFVVSALATAARLPIDSVNRIIAAKSARAIMALCARAGLAARTGVRVQLRLALVPAAQILSARGDDYPLPPAALAEALALFTGE